MLKIKDNVDLNILSEKYGFKNDGLFLKRESRKDTWYDLIYVDIEDRIISRDTEEIGYWCSNVDLTLNDFEANFIKDLINDGLVEEVLDND